MKNNGYEPFAIEGAKHGGKGCGECENSWYDNACGGRGGNDCECRVAASACGAAVSTSGNSQCIDGETHVYFDSCDGLKQVTIASECHNEDRLGRALDVTMTLRNVCPGRRNAVGVTLTEVDEGGSEHARGFRAITVPAHNASHNRDVQLPALRFILPEDVSASRSGSRHFVVRTANHYMDEPCSGWWGKN